MTTKYDKIGINYNRTRKADPLIARRILHHLAPTVNGKYLDIGCGTGNYTNEFQQKGFQFIGIDPSQTMLEKAKALNQAIDWRIGQAEKTGLPENYIEGITASLTIHHWTNLGNGFVELARALKPGGRIVIFTATPKQMKGYWLNHYFPNMLEDSINQMPSWDSIERGLAKSGIKIIETEKYFIKPDLKDFFLYCGKENPALYFNEQIRRGISSFSALANQDDVKTGLSKLSEDINSGKIDAIMDEYKHDAGDYLFVVGKHSV